MAVLQHRAATHESNHYVQSLQYANAAAFLAATPTADDVGRVARVVDTNDFFLLAGVSPTRWEPLSGQYKWTWANAATRVAQAVSASDVGRIGYQADIGREYRLLTATPTWAEQPDREMGLTGLVLANPSVAAFGVVGQSPTSTFGSLAAIVPTATSPATAMPRISIVTASTATNIAVYRAIGSSGAIPKYGFRHQWRFTTEAVSNNERYFVGLCGAIASNVNPYGFASMIGLGRGDNTQSNMWLYSNDASGLPNMVDLGPNFPHAAQTGVDFQYGTRDGLSWFWQVRNLVNGAVVSGVIASKFPADNAPWVWNAYCSNNGDASAVSLGLSSLHVYQRVAAA